MRVFSKMHLVEGSNSYRPEDEIKSGQLFEFALYYASIGQVRVEYDTKEPEKEVIVPVETEQAAPKEPDRVVNPVRRGRPKKQG